MQKLVETESADDFVRDAAMVALSYLTRTGHVSEDETRAFLQRTSTAMTPQGAQIVWMSWVMAVAHLGYRDLADTAEAMIRAARVPSSIPV